MTQPTENTNALEPKLALLRPGDWLRPLGVKRAHAVTIYESKRWDGEAMSACGTQLLCAEDPAAEATDVRCKSCERSWIT